MQFVGVPDHFRLFDEYTEARVFAAMVLDEDDACAETLDVELDDFSDMHLKFAFLAFRNLQAQGKPRDIGEIFAWLWERGYEQPDIVHVTTRIVLAPKYPRVALLHRDTAWLRRLVHRRANEVAIAEREALRRGKR